MARGHEDIRGLRFWRAVISEFIGSVFLVAVGCGAWTDTDNAENSWTLKVSLAFGLTYTGVVYCARSVSDAHINPGITVAMLTTRRISFARGCLYLVGQLVGAVVGAALAWSVRGNIALQASHRAVGGCTVPGRDVTESQGFGVEFLASFFFVFVVFACYDKTPSSDSGSKVKVKQSEEPFVIGLTYSCVLLFAIPYSGGGVNTARSFGPALVNNIWNSHWIYWFGPLMGATCAGATYDVIFSTKASFRRVRACLLAFHSREYTLDEFESMQQAEQQQQLAGGPSSTATFYLDSEINDVDRLRTGNNLSANNVDSDDQHDVDMMREVDELEQVVDEMVENSGTGKQKQKVSGGKGNNDVRTTSKAESLV